MNTIRGLVITCLLLCAPALHAAGGFKAYQGEGITPALTLSDIDNKPHRLADYRGRVVLVNFWATWCPPCVEELPSLERLQQHFKGRDFTLLTVDVGEDAESIRKFMHKLPPVDLKILLDPEGKAHQDWKIYVFPTSFLLDRSGRIRYGAVGALRWDEAEILNAIDALLVEKAPE